MKILFFSYFSMVCQHPSNLKKYTHKIGPFIAGKQITLIYYLYLQSA